MQRAEGAVTSSAKNFFAPLLYVALSALSARKALLSGVYSSGHRLRRLCPENRCCGFEMADGLVLYSTCVRVKRPWYIQDLSPCPALRVRQAVLPYSRVFVAFFLLGLPSILRAFVFPQGPLVANNVK